MRMVNLAHGDLGILAAFVALFIIQSFGLPLLWASVVTIIIMFLVGYVLQRGLLNHSSGSTTRGRSWSPSACRSSSRTR